VVEYFARRRPTLPMKLFTIFASDERAMEHLRGDRPRLDRMISRVADHDEWALRVLFDRKASVPSGSLRRSARTKSSGSSYLSRKKAQRDASIERGQRAQETVADLYDRLAARARLARRRSGDIQSQPATLLLDAAFLVPRSRTASFRGSAAREARSLAPQGYTVTLTGPWPPYSFVQGWPMPRRASPME